jgi:hypothetical protein
MSFARVRCSVGMTLALALTLSYGCGNAPPATQQDAADAADHAHQADPSPEVAAQLDALRTMTAGYTDLAAAQAQGYTEAITPCWYHRDHGGQGVHYARTDLIDGAVSLGEPEIVMYEPLADGSHQFLAIEYIVPFDAWQQDSPPELLGREFMRNERLGLYVLHVWLGKDNPSGMFADWNPNVSCAHAAQSEDRAT